MRGRRQIRTGKETRSTFDKSPEIEIALMDLQKHYVRTGRPKPSMRDLLVSGIAGLLEKEGLDPMESERPPIASVVELTPKGQQK
jgi:hypothetical protein